MKDVIVLTEKDTKEYHERFYVYVYLDPRKPCRYSYDGLDVSFLFEPFYVGRGQGNRIDAHLRTSLLKQKSFKNSKIKSILNSNYEPIRLFLFNYLLNEISNKIETKYIQIIGRLNNNTGVLTNLTDGGDGNCGWVVSDDIKKKIGKKSKGRKHTDETKEKIREKSKGRKHTDETKEKISKLQKGRIGSGFEYTDQVRENISKAQKGRKHTDETKERISKGNKGKKISEETRKKLSDAKKGSTLSQELKNKLKILFTGSNNPKAKTWIIQDINRKEYTINDLVNFCKNNNINYLSLKRKNNKGYRWINGWKIIRSIEKK